MTKDEALKLALEALEICEQDGYIPVRLTTDAITAIKEALTQPEQCQCPNCKVTLHASDCAVHSGPAYPAGGCDCGAQQGPEFFTHNVEQPYDWSEWVCPDPKGYLMKCCDCGLVHEAEFGVVRYKSETEREYCDRVDDPNLQAVFRMRRSEQWSPADTAHRAGGLTMEQPAQQYNATSDHRLMAMPAQQEPVAWPCRIDSADFSENTITLAMQREDYIVSVGTHWLSKTPPQRKPLTDEVITRIGMTHQGLHQVARAIEAAHGIKEQK